MTLIITNARELFFTSAEEYQTWREAHREKARNKALTAEDCAAFALLTGRDLYQAFSPSKKLVANGQPPYAVLTRILDRLSRIHRVGALQDPASPVERMKAHLHAQLRSAPGRSAVIAEGRAAASYLNDTARGL